MYTSTLLLAILPVAFAQYGSSDASTTASSGGASTTASALPGVQTVKVSNNNGDLKFTPDSISADLGTTVEFLFYPKNHTVAQASFALPCQPLNQTKGFFSGNYPTTSGTNPDVFTITINDTKPIWYYCSTGKHCQSGMVGVINPPADGSKTITQFIAAAAKAENNTAPPTVQGGTKVSAADVKSPTATGTAFSSPTGAATQLGGSIQWGLLGLTGAMAAGISGLII